MGGLMGGGGGGKGGGGGGGGGMDFGGLLPGQAALGQWIQGQGEVKNAAEFGGTAQHGGTGHSTMKTYADAGSLMAKVLADAQMSMADTQAINAAQQQQQQQQSNAIGNLGSLLGGGGGSGSGGGGGGGGLLGGLGK